MEYNNNTISNNKWEKNEQAASANGQQQQQQNLENYKWQRNSNLNCAIYLEHEFISISVFYIKAINSNARNCIKTIWNAEPNFYIDCDRFISNCFQAIDQKLT